MNTDAAFISAAAAETCHMNSKHRRGDNVGCNGVYQKSHNWNQKSTIWNAQSGAVAMEDRRNSHLMHCRQYYRSLWDAPSWRQLTSHHYTLAFSVHKYVILHLIANLKIYRRVIWSWSKFKEERKSVWRDPISLVARILFCRLINLLRTSFSIYIRIRIFNFCVFLLISVQWSQVSGHILNYQFFFSLWFSVSH